MELFINDKHRKVGWLNNKGLKLTNEKWAFVIWLGDGF